LPDLETTDKVITWLKTPSITDQQPFFIAAGFYKPHIPLKFPREFLGI
jgi:iduronate 2-sulfatase